MPSAHLAKYNFFHTGPVEIRPFAHLLVRGGREARVPTSPENASHAKLAMNRYEWPCSGAQHHYAYAAPVKASRSGGDGRNGVGGTQSAEEVIHFTCSFKY